MNSWIAKVFAMAVLAASVLVTPSARAQLQGGEGTMTGSNAEGFDDLVAQDVAKGYYTAAQGEQLKAQWDQSMQNLTESELKAQAAVQRTDSLAQSGNQMTLNQLSSLANAQGQTTLGGTPEEIEEQSKAIYNAAHLQLEVGQAQIENIEPVLQTAINEISTVMNARNALIQSNPNVSPTVKHNAGRESAQVEDATKNALQSGIGKFTEQLQQAQATLDNNKQQIINQIENAITTQSAAQGTDPTKWTKPTPPAKTTLPANATVTPNTPATQTPTGSLPTNATTYTPSNNGSVTGTTTHTTTGTVPSNEGDPALSATRNSNNGKGTASSSNSGTSTSANSKTSAANNGAPSSANNSSSSAAKAATGAATQASKPQSTTTPPKAQTPPAKPKVTQQDLNNALNKQQNIPNLPIATPPSKTPTNAPVDPTAIGLTDKNNPSQNGNAVNKNAPASKSGQPVLMPSSNQSLGMQNQTNQNDDNSDQSQNAAQQNTGTATGTAAGTAASTAAADAANAAGDAAANAAATAADSSSASQASSQSSQSKPTIIPTTLNNPNAESNNDPSFNANRNNPNPDPATSISNSGDVTNGSTSADPGGFVPPNQQDNSQDSSTAAQAADAAAAAAAAGVTAASSAPAQASTPPANQSSGQPTLDQIQAQIASQMKAGNLGGHLVEGDEGMEGATSTAAGTQLAAISNLDTSVELGDTLSVATLASIYTGYTVTPGQNGSSVIVAGTTQVQTPSSLMTSPSMQVSTPGALMTSPSMQVQFPTSVMTDPSMQVQFPDALLVIPSSQINFPSSLMSSLEMQVALCGR
jgi:hypothetical protein